MVSYMLNTYDKTLKEFDTISKIDTLFFLSENTITHMKN